MAKLENLYKAQLKERIEYRLPGCIVLKNDEQLLQGIFDMTILYGRLWAALEVKRSATARFQPNQEYYLNQVLQMGGIAFVVYPENEEEVLDEIQRAFQTAR